MSHPRHRSRRAFSLIEVMVVVAIIAMLTSVLLPTLSGARGAARAAACGSNLRQITTCLHAYAGDFKGLCAPGAPDFLSNLRRWHGSRARPSDAFASAGGSLSVYLGSDSGIVRECPTFAPVLADLAAQRLGFERSCGGYGYNNAFVGVVRARDAGGCFQLVTDRSGSALSRFASPGSTIVFADAAIESSQGRAGVVEYSFVEPRFWADVARGDGARPDPSLHFRHGARNGRPGTASAAYLDGHVSPETRTFEYSSGVYGPPAQPPLTGWTGSSDDNALFDYE